MEINEFFSEMMAEEYPNCGWLRYWWEGKKLDIWLKLPTGNGKQTNKDFVKEIPSPKEH